jgi:hypothetical protein
VVAVGGSQLHDERTFRNDCLRSDQMETGADVAALSAPHELTVVRSYREHTNAFWRRRTNFEEPVVLYHARRRGWVLPADGFLPESLADMHRRGARVVVDQMPDQTPPESRAWLGTGQGTAWPAGVSLARAIVRSVLAGAAPIAATHGTTPQLEERGSQRRPDAPTRNR